MIDDVLERLKRSPILRAASDDDLRKLAGHAEPTVFEPGHHLFHEGDPATRVWLLVEGIVRIYHEVAEREQTTAFLLPPNTVGEIEVIAESIGTHKPGYLVNAAAARRVEALRIPADPFVELLDRDATVSGRMLRDIATRFRVTASRERSAFYEVAPRLASFLLVLGEMVGRETERGLELRQPLTWEDLARGIGATVRSIARVTKDWADKDWVTRHKGWWVIKNRDALSALCGDVFELQIRIDWPD